MSLDTLLTEPPPLTDTDTPATPDPRIARAEERLCMLRELAEMGMELTRALVRQHAPAPEAAETADAAPASPAPPAASGPRRDPADAFARLSRAVRLTLALEATTDDAIAARRAGASGSPSSKDALVATGRAAGRGPVTAAPEPMRLSLDDISRLPPVERAQAFMERFGDDYAEAHEALTWENAHPLPRDYPTDAQNKIRDSVINVINHEVRDQQKAEKLLDELYERLWEGERYYAFVRRPLKNAVAVICEDLGITPNWRRWTDDGWPAQPRPGGNHWDYTWHPKGSMKPRARLFRPPRETPAAASRDLRPLRPSP